MERVAEVVDGKLYRVTVKHEAAFVYAVGISADRGAEVGLVDFREISLYAVESEYDIAKISIAVGHHYRHHASAVVGDAYFHSLSVDKSIECSAVAPELGLEGIGVEA